MLLPRFITIELEPGLTAGRRQENSGGPLALHGPQDQVSSIMPSPSNSQPFFPDPSSVTPPPGDSDPKGPLVKSVLEYVFLVIALLLVTGIIVRRYMCLRKSKLPISKFFALGHDISPNNDIGPRSFPRTTGIPPISRDMPYPEPHLSGFPSAYLSLALRRPREPIRATDVDANGRRVHDPAIELDHDGMLTDKDALPAYDNYGGPPKYMEIDLTAPPRASVVGNGPSRAVVDITSRFPVTRSPQSPTSTSPLTPMGNEHRGEGQVERPSQRDATIHPISDNTRSSSPSRPLDDSHLRL